jgi:hypothetical protein
MLNYDIEDSSERLDEDYQENSLDSNIYFCQINKFSSKYIEIEPTDYSNNPISLDKIAKVFPIDETQIKDLHLSKIKDELAPYINTNKSMQSFLKSESPIQKNEIKDSKPQSNDNKDLEIKPYLNTNNKENQNQINPLSGEQSGINEINFNTNSFCYIIDILKKNNYQAERIIKIKGDITQKDIKNISLFDVKNKKKKNKKEGKKKKEIGGDKEKNINKQEIYKNKIKYGRKKIDDNEASQGRHKKDCPDNIVKKIKAFLFTSVIEYVENYINSQNIIEKIKLQKLDYKYVNNLKKEDNVKLLNEPLKNIVSLESSSRYTKGSDKYWNKKMIKKILDKEKNNEKINSLLNMRFSIWIDIFTCRQKWENNIQFDKINNYLEKIQDENDSQYFSKFIFYLFNYQLWFLHKKGRKPKSNRKSE